MKYFIIGDEDAVLGFGLVGVEGRVCASSEEARSAFKAVLDDREIGIIIITERIADMIREQVNQYLFREKFPLIVEIMDRKGPVPGKPNIKQMVNEAIGIKL